MITDIEIIALKNAKVNGYLNYIQGCFMNTPISPLGNMIPFLLDCYAHLLSGFCKNAQNIPFEHLHTFFSFILSLIKAFYSTENIFFNESMVITEFVHHFGHQLTPFFSYHGDPEKVVADLPQQSQIIFRFLCW